MPGRPVPNQQPPYPWPHVSNPPPVGYAGDPIVHESAVAIDTEPVPREYTREGQILGTPLYDDGMARVRRPPQPGEESAGPALEAFVYELASTRQVLEALFHQAKFIDRRRVIANTASITLDASGNGALFLYAAIFGLLPALFLYAVPQSYTGYLMLVALEEDGATPNAPDTPATAWHAIYETSELGSPTAAQVIALGGLRDFQTNGAVAGKSRLPDVYKYGDKVGAPSAVGPQGWYVFFQNFTASRRVVANWQVLIEANEAFLT